MKDEIKEILDRLERIDHIEYKCSFEFADSASFEEMCRCFEERKKMADYITTLQKENKRLNNIINTMLDFDFFKNECPLNFGYQEECDEEKAQEVFYEDDYCEENCNDDYKKCWLKYFERLQELKENK